MTETRHRIIALLLAMLFVSYYAGSTMCEHVHYVDNVMVVHSHPFGGAGHTHSASAMQALSVLNATMQFTYAELAMPFVAAILLFVVTAVAAYCPCSLQLKCPSLRAPPVIDCQ